MKKLIKKVPASVLLIILLAAILRFSYLPEKLSFLYDQGRDALVVKDIIGGNLTLIGPATDIPGVFHGVAHYYLMLLGYFLTGGHPMGASSIYIIFNLAAVYLIYLLGKKLFSHRVGLIAVLIMAASYGAVAYSRWLSNPSPVPFWMLLLIYSLYQLSRSKEKFFITLAVSWAMIFHAEVVAALFFLPTVGVIFWFSKSRMPSKKIMVLSFLGALLILSPYFLFELRHQFLMTNSAGKFLFKEGNLSFGFNFETLKSFLTELDFMILPFLPELSAFVLIASLLLVIYRLLVSQKTSENRSLLIIFSWLAITPIILGFYNHAVHPHFFIALGPAMILAISFLIDFLLGKKPIFKFIGASLLIFILGYNLFLDRTALPDNKGIIFYGAQTHITLGEQIKAVDFVYKDAQGKPFRYEALGLPYFYDQTWQYLFAWYGQRKYHYQPTKENTKLVFFIIEDIITSPEYKQFKEDWLEEKGSVVNYLSETQVEDIIIIRAEKNN